MYPNLFGAHPPFQIDGNFGVTAGIAECSSRVTPAKCICCPHCLRVGRRGPVRGLRARGGFEVDITWQEGRLARATISLVSGARAGFVQLRGYRFAQPSPTKLRGGGPVSRQSHVGG